MNHLCPILDRPTATQPTPFRRDHWQIVQCSETGFTFLANPPKYEMLQEVFAWEKTYESEKQRRQQAEPAFAVASKAAKDIKHLIAPKRIRIADIALRALRVDGVDSIRLLDVGCGGGELMLELHRRISQLGKQVEPVGIEVSLDLSQTAESRVQPLGGKLVKTYAVEGCRELAGEQFDLVVMSCFLEHEAKPLELLKMVRAILSDRGVVVIKVPNFACWNRRIRGSRWCGFRFPDHVNYFTPKTLKRLAQEAGYSKLEQPWFDRFPLSDNMYAVLRS